MNSRIISVNLPIYCKKSSRAWSLSYFVNQSANSSWLLTASQQNSPLRWAFSLSRVWETEVILTSTVRSALMNCYICRMFCCLQDTFPFLIQWHSRVGEESAPLISPRYWAQEVRGLRPSILCYIFSCTESHCPAGQAHFWQVNSHLKSHLSRVRKSLCWHRKWWSALWGHVCIWSVVYPTPLVLNGCRPGNKLEREAPLPSPSPHPYVPDWLSQANLGLLGPRGLVLINPPGYSDACENLRATGLPSKMAEDQ